MEINGSPHEDRKANISVYIRMKCFIEMVTRQFPQDFFF